MNKDLKIKIIGEDISDLFLAFLLPKKVFKVQVFKKNNIYNQINQFIFNKKTFDFLKLKFLILKFFKLIISIIFDGLFIYIKKDRFVRFFVFKFTILNFLLIN
tara:strand:+ start:233 stop:541 length:309 start_codon:yes stop_codon:yes gene_type:complete